MVLFAFYRMFADTLFLTMPSLLSNRKHQKLVFLMEKKKENAALTTCEARTRPERQFGGGGVAQEMEGASG